MIELAFTRISKFTNNLTPATSNMPNREHATLKPNAQIPEAFDGVSITSQLEALLPASPSNIETGDWDDLFRAVEARLTAAVGDGLSNNAEPRVHDSASRIQVIVLECVAALGQLHKMLECERDRSAELEREAFDAQTALGQARAELAVLHAEAARAARAGEPR